ncbi:hypothetical protein O3P69_009246 [Scylla paramamosain]|uniref:Mitochondrial cytochrome c oxidase subunit VIc/VIIs domain-containing protein n=1 Tax=Scylla paramamosain TaxID=85552 RepID=A0AAW0TAD9_SCYPA
MPKGQWTGKDGHFSTYLPNYSNGLLSAATTTTTTMTLAKPVMRGLLTAQIKKNLIVASGLSVISVLGWKFFFQYPRMQGYADFYKTYDAQKEFDRIRNLGLFHGSCRRDMVQLCGSL